MKNLKRDKLVLKILSLRKKEEEIRKQLDEIDYKEKFNDANQYEGKYFKEKTKYHDENVRCLFVYSINNETCEPMALCINYWVNNKTSYFGIDYHGHFHPKKWVDDEEKWEEISKDEYMKHYDEVQLRISLALNKKLDEEK